MSYWTASLVNLYLSEAGRKALAGFFDSEVVQVSVEWSDELGLWIVCEPLGKLVKTVMLVRWSHIETAVLDVTVEEPKPQNILGFRR